MVTFVTNDTCSLYIFISYAFDWNKFMKLVKWNAHWEKILNFDISSKYLSHHRYHLQPIEYISFLFVFSSVCYLIKWWFSGNFHNDTPIMIIIFWNYLLPTVFLFISLILNHFILFYITLTNKIENPCPRTSWDSFRSNVSNCSRRNIIQID